MKVNKLVKAGCLENKDLRDVAHREGMSQWLQRALASH